MHGTSKGLYTNVSGGMNDKSGGIDLFSLGGGCLTLGVNFRALG